MSDRYARLANAPLIGALAGRAGLPRPVELQRHRPGDPVIDGPVVLGQAPGGHLAQPAAHVLHEAAIAEGALDGSSPLKGLVFDASGIHSSERLVELRDFFYPLLGRLADCGRVVVLGDDSDACENARHATSQRALEGFTRSLAKEVERGATAQLVLVKPGGEGHLASTLRFLLSPRSAYVSGQVIGVGPGLPAEAIDWDRPLAEHVALVTGASRGIGRAIAEVLSRDGAAVVGLDVPAMASELEAAMGEIGGSPLTLDITSEDAPARIAERFSMGLDVVVHNAGVTRDRTLAKMPADRWQGLMEINLTSEERINEALLDGVLGPGSRIVCVSSMSGIAGNAGQTNYATSKAGVIGMVESLAPELFEQQMTINAVAPGFIETKMTDAMPLTVREAGRRLNSLRQGGRPVDVAETIAWLAGAASGGLNGNVIRVCGQSLLGA